MMNLIIKMPGFIHSYYHSDGDTWLFPLPPKRVTSLLDPKKVPNGWKNTIKHSKNTNTKAKWSPKKGERDISPSDIPTNKNRKITNSRQESFKHPKVLNRQYFPKILTLRPASRMPNWAWTTWTPATAFVGRKVCVPGPCCPT